MWLVFSFHVQFLGADHHYTTPFKSVLKYKWYWEAVVILLKSRFKWSKSTREKKKVWVRERESGLGTVGQSGRSLASPLPTPPMRGCRVTNCLKTPAVHKCRTQLSRLLLQWLLCQHLALIIGASRSLLLRLLTAKMFCESGWKKNKIFLGFFGHNFLHSLFMHDIVSCFSYWLTVGASSFRASQ